VPWKRIVLSVLLAALVGGLCFLYRAGQYPEWNPEPLEGRLTVNGVASQSVKLGAFEVAWDGDTRRLAVLHDECPDRTCWASVPGEPFVGATQGAEQVTEARGSFFVHDDRHALLGDQTIESISAEAGSFSIRGTLQGDATANYVLSFNPGGSGGLDFALDIEGANRAFLTYASDPGERFYGFGEQFSHVDLKGRRVPIFVSEQGIGRGEQPLTFFVNLFAQSGGHWHTSYAPVPHYLTSRLRSLFLKNYAYSAFDLRAADRVQIEVFDDTLNGRVLAGGTPAKLIERYTEYAGRMRPLPDWILEGAVVGMQGGTEKVREVHAQFQELGTPLAGYWLQDWVGQRTTMVGKQLWWNWELDTDHYPKWDELRALLAEDDVRLLIYFNPFLADVAGVKPNVRRNLFDEAAERGFLVEEHDGTPYLLLNTDFSAGLLDLTDVEARNWIKEVMKEQIVLTGATGWMADFGEALPYDTQLSSGEPTRTYHNRYPEVWAQLNRELIEEIGLGDEAVFFHRSAFTRSPAYATLFWEGDQTVAWDRHDGLKSAIIGLQSSGFSGFAFNHSDIGGYTAITSAIKNYHRSEELLLRWMDANAFTVVFRSHEGIDPDKNVQVYDNERTRGHFDRMARVYVAWADYRKALVREASNTGLPVVRHPFLHFPDDTEIQGMNGRQFMVGDELMVVPVTQPDRATWRCYLPAGEWVHV